MAFNLIVEAFPERGDIPKPYTCEGEDKAPALSWDGEPPRTKSFAIIVDDPDAPSGTFTHWLQYDIPASVHSLPEKGNAGLSGMNDFGSRGYNGPCPPKGHGPHRYFFKIYALDTELKLDSKTTKDQLSQAMKDHLLAQGELIGRYKK